MRLLENEGALSWEEKGRFRSVRCKIMEPTRRGQPFGRSGGAQYVASSEWIWFGSSFSRVSQKSVSVDGRISRHPPPRAGGGLQALEASLSGENTQRLIEAPIFDRIVQHKDKGNFSCMWTEDFGDKDQMGLLTRYYTHMANVCLDGPSPGELIEYTPREQSMLWSPFC